MSAELPFSSDHITSLAARAAELEQIGEELQDPHALVRAARLYTLAVRIADDIDSRDALPFMRSDLARVRDELRTLATDAATMSPSNRASSADDSVGSNGTITRMFREVALRIEQRLAKAEAR
jgi:hypothetical protein